MKRYLPYAGFFGVVATVGLFAYVNRDQLYEESEIEEEFWEETEYEAELPEKTEVPVPYTKKTEKEKSVKIKPSVQNHQRKETQPRNQSPRRPSPQTSGLEETVEENEEKPWYDLPPEKRQFQTWEELGKYFNAALNAKDYKVAESYIQYAEQFVEPKTIKNTEEQKKAITYVIISRYNEYLNEIIENCKDQNYESLFRKVMWMNFFATENEQAFPIIDPETRKDLNLTSLYQKGNQALEAIEYCR